MTALSTWNGGVILISHDERFITNVAKEVRGALLPRSPGLSIDRLLLALGMRGRDCFQVQGRRPGVQGNLQPNWSLRSLLTLRRASSSATSKQSREMLCHQASYQASILVCAVV